MEDAELPPNIHEYAQTMMKYTQQLTDLTDDMLTIAEIEGGNQVQIKLIRVEVAAFMRKLEPALRQKTDEKHLKLDVAYGPNNMSVLAQETYLETIIWNIVDNAIKFTPEGGSITIVVDQTGDKAVLSVKDTGQGIAPEELPKLFTKFHRGTSVMEYNFEGVGLGLYMTKLMIGLMNGTIRASSVPGQGSTFTIELSTYPASLPSTS
jgi:signal transduction histidine kinase